ncbi:GNAT family N-acetyltransferase [Paramagnetospirillum kuznetsovii]|uniref:GNAT family N-acetyltransferase n=1 Tax=Paramagnetospirillum kuznetsovii TaxID=2053833 RepID=A0A364NYH2_9PROT|nr:bifunctional acetate--CoA ligase family protein/GNAT family N-acetyltransferase [Paramagnetospirillum kuznetsovii]RAU22050.1 GNAT family N-acetyltransferase [Paramagnetospirillum kuznetsovii]
MSIRNLSYLFEPTSVAVIGASDRPRSAGAVVMRNLLAGGFKGPIMPVHPRHRAVAGVLAYPNVDSLPLPPDLAVLCAPGAVVPAMLESLGRIGTRAAVVIAADADKDAMKAAAAPHHLRLLGRGSLGVLVPRIGLDASFSHISALPGKVALVSQSGALCSAVLDWARPRGIGFSHFVSLGESDDIDFADVMDYLANDDQTRAILLYIESIGARRNFMAAARAAARNKPVLLVRAGGVPDDHQLGTFLSEALARPEDAFNAAIRRAGALRVNDINELFGAVETLARAKPMKGNRLAILSNGGGTAMMAKAEMGDPDGGQIAELSEETLRKLAALMPRGWTADDPVDLGVDALGKRYAETLRVLIEAEEVDAILVVHAPNAMSDPVEAAQSVIDTQRRFGGAVLTSWVGEEAVAPARKLFAEAGLPTYDTPGRAVRAFRHQVNYQRNQDMLMETPPAHLAGVAAAKGTARLIVERGLTTPGGLLNEPDAKAMLSAYGIPVQPSLLAKTVDDAVKAAETLGYPVALTLAAADLARKWDIGGVALNLETAEAVRQSAEGILRRVKTQRPGTKVEGFTVQTMVFRPHARQLVAGIACDPLFGPVLVFGEGGRAVEVVRDHTVGLPPLNLPLARGVIARTRVSRLLNATGARPAANRDAIAEVLVRLSSMLVDNPEIVACDINPLFADENGVLALDARIRVAPWEDTDLRHFSVLPYPAELEEPARLHDGSNVTLRPIRPEDQPAHADLMGRMTPQDLRLRFFGQVRQIHHHQMARLTQIDYEREMAFIASRLGKDGQPETLGVVRTVTDPDNQRAELAVLVRSDMKGTGLGSMLMDKIIRYQKSRGTKAIYAQIMAENSAMVRLALKCGFLRQKSDDPDVVEAALELE